MSHVVLDVIIEDKSSLRPPSKAACQKAIDKAGGLKFLNTPYEPTARALSKLPWVSRVVATHVSEHNVGTWRNGRKSC